MTNATYPKKKTDCRACSLRDECRGVIRGIGEWGADVLVIGSYPDELSELRGEPFHPDGFEGRQLDRIRELLCLEWKDLRLTYAAACRPEEGRPSKADLLTCRHWLEIEEKKMTAARVSAMNYGNELIVQAHPILLGIGNDAAFALGLCSYGVPAVEVAGRWYRGTGHFEHNPTFVLQGFETLRPPVIPSIRDEWSAHLETLVRGLQLLEIGEDPGRSIAPEIAAIRDDPFVEDEETG